MRPRVVVVGGGLAGLRAALDCADAGAHVELLERRPRLGGLTWSFERDGRWIDNGQHVFLRCCTAYLEFLERIGSAGDVELQPRLDVTVMRPASDRLGCVAEPVTGRLRRNRLPAPLHLGASLARYPHLSLRERSRLLQAAWPLRTLDLNDRALDDETFAAWLSRHGQSDRSIDALWDLITVATVNLPARQASLAMGAKVFETGLLTRSDAGDVGWARVPLAHLHGRPAAQALAAAGVEVSCSEPALAITASPLAARTERRTIDADAVVMAVPHTVASSILPPGSVAGQDRWIELGTSAIVNVHVVFDRPVTDLPLFASVGSAAQWVFDRTESSGLRRSGAAKRHQYLAVSLSAADAELATRPEDLAKRVTADLRRVLPAAAKAHLVDTLVTKERQATFRAVPGTARLRPGPVTGIPGLVLAGAWTDTGWPATMEGAVRSGRLAARAALLAVGASSRTLPKEAA